MPAGRPPSPLTPDAQPRARGRRGDPPARTTALLHSYAGAIVISGGDPVQARRSWTRARGAAARAANPQLAAYVGGKQAVQGLYGAYSPAQVLMLADDALATTRQPCTGRMSALCARGPALAMLKRVRPARDGYRDVEREFERLPRDVTREKLSALGFAEERMHNSRSFAGMFIGGGEPARDEALRLYAAPPRCGCTARPRTATRRTPRRSSRASARLSAATAASG